jgi:hypothetical protein
VGPSVQCCVNKETRWGARDRTAHVCLAAPGGMPTDRVHQHLSPNARHNAPHASSPCRPCSLRCTCNGCAHRHKNQKRPRHAICARPARPLFAWKQSHQGEQPMPRHATRPTPPGTSTPGTPRPAPHTPGAHVRLVTWLMAAPNTTGATHDTQICSPWRAHISQRTAKNTVRYHGRKTGHIQTIPCTIGQLCRKPVLAVCNSSMAACIHGVMRAGFRHTVQVVHRSLLCEETPSMRQ